MNRYKPVGWRFEVVRHSLAAKGVKTKYVRKWGDLEIVGIKKGVSEGRGGGYFPITKDERVKEAAKISTENAREEENKILNGLKSGAGSKNFYLAKALESEIVKRERKRKENSLYDFEEDVAVGVGKSSGELK